MLCQQCGQRPASVHILKTVNNHKEELHLCDVCARDKGQSGMQPSFGFPNFSLQQLLASMLEEPWVLPGPRAQGSEPRCAGCGLSFSQFRETGFLGCTQCYETFRDELAPLVRRIHASENHHGKAPKRSGGLLRLKKELHQLKLDLQRAVAREAFEEAAQIRDRIRGLEQKLQAGGEGHVVE